MLHDEAVSKLEAMAARAEEDLQAGRYVDLASREEVEAFMARLVRESVERVRRADQKGEG